MKLWKKLNDHLEAKGYAENDLNSLLKFIDALENPIEFSRVLNNFLLIIPSMISLVKLYTGFDLSLPLFEWQNICLELISDPTTEKILIGTNKSGKMPLKGCYDTNPVYVALWQRPGSSSDRQKYFLLIAHCLIAIAVLRNRMDAQELKGISEQKFDNFKRNIITALLAVRNLSIPENWCILESLPSELNVAPKNLLDILEKSSEDLAPLKVLLKYLLRIRKPPHRHEHEGGEPIEKRNQETEPPASITEISSNLDPEQEESTSEFNLLQLPLVGESKAKELESSGCSPSESFSGVEIVAPKMSKSGSKQIKSPTQRCLPKGRIKTQLAMLNQRLTSRWEVLSNHEVSVFLSAIEDLVEKKEEVTNLSDNITNGELAAILTTMFWFGQRLNKLKVIKIYHEVSKEKTAPGFVAKTELNGFWWTKPAVPLRKILPDVVQQEQAYPTVFNFALCTGISVEMIISAYIIDTHRRKSIYLFPKTQTTYDKRISDFLSVINSRYATRLTANRISDFLFEVISRQDGADITSAMFIIGRENFIGRTPSYYTSIAVTSLQDLYMEVCRGIMKQHFNESPRDNQSQIYGDLTVSRLVTDRTGHVGSPFRPTSSTVGNLVTELKESLKKSAHGEATVLKLMRVHNSMTRYTAFLVAFSTGFRAVRDPFLSAAEIDWNSGFAILRDKDNEDGYNSRMIWLPPVCLQQLKFFRKHQQNALYRFSILIPNIFLQPDRPRRDVPGHYMFYAKTDEDNNEYVAMTLGPKLIGTRLRSIYALPFNASRHYLRSCLLGKDCPVEVINAFMGHFERGEEPWGIFSGFSPITYRDTLKEYLVPLLKDDGWEALPGLNVQL